MITSIDPNAVRTVESRTLQPAANASRAAENNPRPRQLAVRIDPSNPNHHLWNNNGTWFIHYTVWPDKLTSRRVRRSLGTRSVLRARIKRDRFFASESSADGLEGDGQ